MAPLLPRGTVAVLSTGWVARSPMPPCHRLLLRVPAGTEAAGAAEPGGCAERAASRAALGFGFPPPSH